MSISILNKFSSTVFCEVPCIYKTDRLWKAASIELDALPCKRAIYNIPEDSSNIQLEEKTLSSGVFVLRGVTKSGYHEPTTSMTMPFKPLLDQEVNDLLLLGELKPRLSDLAHQFDVEIVVSKDLLYGSSTPAKEQVSFFIHLLGWESHVSTAFLHLWSLLQVFRSSKDNLSSPTFIECLDLPAASLLPMAIGVEMANMRQISTSYETEMHIPSLINSYKSETIENCRPQVFFSGKRHSLVIAAKESIQKTVANYEGALYYRRFSNISPQKLLFIQKHYQPELNRLMVKYQSFIRVTDTFVEFQAPCLPLLESITKVFTINVLHQIVEIQLIFNADYHIPGDVISSICMDDTEGPVIVAVAEAKWNQLLIVGNHSEKGLAIHTQSRKNGLTNRLFRIVSALQPQCLVQLKAIFEIHADYEDFIAGKKNGKVTRIMETVPCLIKLERLGEDSAMFLTLIADSLENFNKTFSLVINELPAEESFFIPEVYHRPVIGAGGSVIQTTMKKYNVFVRFSNSFFLPQNHLCHVRYDNVIIRCPYKNVASISSAKEELNHLARNCGRSQPRCLIRFSPGQYRHLLSTSAKGCQIIGSIEKKYNVYIMFPFVEPPEGYFLEIRGNDDSPFAAATDLIDSSFGFETEIRVNKDIKLSEEFYSSLVIPFKNKMKIELAASGSIVRLTYEKGNLSLNKAFGILLDWLKLKNLELISKETIKEFMVQSKNLANRSDPFADEAQFLEKAHNTVFQQALSVSSFAKSRVIRNPLALNSPQTYQVLNLDGRNSS